jgi:hypothetical protein
MPDVLRRMPDILRHMPVRTWRRIALFGIGLLIAAGCGPCDVFDSGPPWVDLNDRTAAGVWSAKKVHLQLTTEHAFVTDNPGAFGATARFGTWSVQTPAENVGTRAVLALAFDGESGVALYAIKPSGTVELDYFADGKRGETAGEWHPDLRLTKCTKNCPTIGG